MSSIGIACTNRTVSSAMTHPSAAPSKKHRQTIATKAIPQETPSSKRYEPIAVSSEAAKRYEKGIKSWKPLLHAYPRIRPKKYVGRMAEGPTPPRAGIALAAPEANAA